MLGFSLERVTLMDCSHSSLILFLVLISTNFENPCSQRYDVTNGVRISRATLAIRGYILPFGSTKSLRVLLYYCTKDHLLNVSLLEFNKIVQIIMDSS